MLSLLLLFFPFFLILFQLHKPVLLLEVWFFFLIDALNSYYLLLNPLTNTVSDK